MWTAGTDRSRSLALPDLEFFETKRAELQLGPSDCVKHGESLEALTFRSPLVFSHARDAALRLHRVWAVYFFN